jgi:hypothetical protein
MADPAASRLCLKIGGGMYSSVATIVHEVSKVSARPDQVCTESQQHAGTTTVVQVVMDPEEINEQDLE